MSILYELSVLGGELTRQYTIIFRIIQKKDKFHVWYITGDVSKHCRRYDNFNNALRYLNSAIKLAMKNDFLYRICPHCLKMVFYPFQICECDYYFTVTDELYKNENVFKQYNKLLKYDRDTCNWSKYAINSYQQTKKCQYL